MSDDKPKVPTISGVDLATALAQEIAKQLPVKDIYQDGVSAPLKEAGGLLTDVVKTIRLALAPIQLTAALQDHFRPFIEKAFSRVKEEDRIAPAPQIMGPVLEGKKFEPDDTPINEMFSELLSRACDRTRAAQAHPSYPMLIRQLSSDEALLLMRAQKRGSSGIFEMEREYEGFNSKDAHLVDPGMDPSELSFLPNIGFYLRRLSHMDLLQRDQDVNPIEGSTDLLSAGKYKKRERWILSPAGVEFMKATTAAPVAES